MQMLLSIAENREQVTCSRREGVLSNDTVDRVPCSLSGVTELLNNGMNVFIACTQQ
jgi:hypothetical protein